MRCDLACLGIGAPRKQLTPPAFLPVRLVRRFAASGKLPDRNDPPEADAGAMVAQRLVVQKR
jgi:hypothetical protein